MESGEKGFIGALNLVDASMRIRAKFSRVIKKSDIVYDPSKKIIVGGASAANITEESYPSIFIEKENEVMSKILVRCPCGRHSELICVYDDEPSTKERQNQ